MSGPRLTFLYPSLFKPALFRESTAAVGRLRHIKPHKNTLSTSALRKQETYAQRYGSATEPQLPPPSQSPVPNDLGREKSLAGAFEKEVKSPASTAKDQKAEPKAQPKDTSKPTREAATPKEPGSSPPEGKEKLSGNTQAQQKLNPTEPPRKETPPTTATSSAKDVRDSKPLDTVLNRTAAPPLEEYKPPHMQTPPYLHHFDTYSLVHSLHAGGFTPLQSITLMKTVRGLLTANLSIARSALVSRSDVENETYLFRAACSELRTEIANARRLSHQKTATQLAHLQHEVEILGQRLAQEGSALKDDLRGVLNDRRMAVRMEQQGMEQSIQELNYKITVALNSEAKSEVEGMRWVLTKRTALALGGMAFFIFNCLLLMRSRDHEAKRLADKNAKENPPPPSSSSSPTSPSSSSSTYTVPSREMSTQTAGGGGSADTEAMLANVSKDGNPAYVSLG